MYRDTYMNKTSFAIFAIVIFACVGAGCAPTPSSAPLHPVPVTSTTPVANTNPTSTPAVQPNMVVVDSPQPLTAVKSPLHILGKAPGTWYFEATFPVSIIDANGKILGTAAARAQGDWMTTSSVPFDVELTFLSPTTQTGNIILKKDNPSGLPQNDQELRVPVKFETDQISMLFSKSDTTKYCNGADMDSEGYRKTIVAPKTVTLPSADLSGAKLAKAVAVLATTGQCHDALSQMDFTMTGDTINIPPMDGWAGISIAMCSCKPQVEVNLLRLPGVNKVVWD